MAKFLCCRVEVNEQRGQGLMDPFEVSHQLIASADNGAQVLQGISEGWATPCDVAINLDMMNGKHVFDVFNISEVPAKAMTFANTKRGRDLENKYAAFIKDFCARTGRTEDDFRF